MKKLLLILAIAAFSLASEVKSTSVFATAFKTASKLAVPMTFTNHEFKFGKQSGNINEILSGTKATVMLDSIDTDKNALRDRNIITKFFVHFKDKVVKATIKSVNGDDKSGSFVAEVIMNGAKKDLTFGYEVHSQTLTAKTFIDVSKDFNLGNAFKAFETDKIIEGLHAKKTWSEVEIGFDIKLSM